MNPEQLKFRIALTLLNGVGNSIARNLIAYLGSEEAIFSEKKPLLMKIPGIGEATARQIVNHQDALRRAEAEIEFILKNKVSVHYYSDDSYPSRLRECNDAPLILYSRCAAGFNTRRVVSIVGTRNATEYGKRMCHNLVMGLSGIPSLLIVSGLAYGIDICAHKASLEANLPTVGVVAHGLDRIYPGHHRATAVQMLEKGGLVTEYLSNTNPDRQNFIQRNRIIAGMSDVIVIVESGLKGGALITADLGGDYNRDVFAFPGRSGDEWSKGCNLLIKNNRAGLIESADDLLNSLGWMPSVSSVKKSIPGLFPELTADESVVYAAIQSHGMPIQVNDLARTTKLPYNKVSAVLLNLEFKSVIRCMPGNCYVCIDI